MVVARNLRPLLNTAAKIADLLQQFHAVRADPMVGFQGRCDGQDVDWMTFFYARHRAFVLVQCLSFGWFSRQRLART